MKASKLVSVLLLAGGAACGQRSCSAGAEETRRGPFEVQFPVEGLKSEDSAKVERALRKALGARNIERFKCEEGRLSFDFGGEGPKSMLTMSGLRSALESVEWKLAPRSWVLSEQVLGISFSAEPGMNVADLRKAIEGTGTAVLGMILHGEGLFFVLQLKKDVEFAALEKALGVTIRDLAWGHWKYGWKIEADCHGHAAGAILRKSE